MSAEWVLLFCSAFIWNLEVHDFYNTSEVTTCSSTPFLKTNKSLGLRRNVWDSNLLCFKSQRLNQNLNCPYVIQVRKINWWESHLGQSNPFTINHKVLFILSKKKSDHCSIPIANISCPQSYTSNSLSLSIRVTSLEGQSITSCCCDWDTDTYFSLGANVIHAVCFHKKAK